MKKIINRMIGLSAILAMVFNLCAPMIVVAAPESGQIELDPNAGRWLTDSSEPILITAEGQDQKITKEQMEQYFLRNAPQREGYTFLGWMCDQQLYEVDGDNWKEGFDTSKGGLTFKAVWGKNVTVNVKHVGAEGEKIKATFTTHLNANNVYRISEQKMPGITQAISELDPGLQRVSCSIKGIGNFDDISSIFTTDFSDDLTIEVTYERILCTVRYYNNIGPEDTSYVDDVVKYGEKWYSGTVPQPNVLKNGYKFVGWCRDRNHLDLYPTDLEITEETLEVFAKWSKIYEIIDGNHNLEIQKGMNLVVRADGDLAKFKRLLIDGKEVDKSNYDIKSGSTIVVLKSSYLDTLTPGSHEITFEYEDGEASTNFTTVSGDGSYATVESSDDKSSTTGGSPKTGDSGIEIWAGLLLMSVAGVAVSIVCLKKVK